MGNSARRDGKMYGERKDKIDGIIPFLQARGEEQELLFKHARVTRETYFGNKAIVRGVVEVTNSCRRDCGYCPMRKSNSSNKRYLMQPDQIVEAVKPIKDSGIRVVFLQGGETPATTRTVGQAIPKIRELFDGDVEIVLGLGNKSFPAFSYLKKQGANGYVIKHETSDPELHSRMRDLPFTERFKALRRLLHLGYKVGTGNIVGLPGQTLESVAEDILLPVEYGMHMTSCAPLIPAENTPLENQSAGDLELTLNTIALMRIYNKSALIPSVSALEKLQVGGQVRGFNAGANVITVNFTPEREQKAYEIYGRRRFVVGLEHALRTIERAGLSAGLGDENEE